MSAIEELQARGFVAQMTPDMPEGLIPYVGFDLTAPALHVGSLIQLRAIRTFLRHGCTPIVLLGEATTKIGDPSDKDKSRPMLDEATIADNRTGIERIIRRICPTAKIVSNAEWMGDKGFLDFLREYGQHFTINRMLAMESVDRRLREQKPMTFLEFSYMLLQAVDFLHLLEREGVCLQIGGSDQWGNIVNGIDLVRRTTGNTVHGLTTVLLTDAEGNKVGKTAGGKTVWLDPEMTSPWDFYQFWRNTPDELVERYMLLFAEIDPEESRAHIRQDINEAKMVLARCVTQIVHGLDVARDMQIKAREVFAGREAEIGASPLPGEMLTQFIHRVGFAESRGAARRLLQGNAVSVDGKKVSEDQTVPLGLIKVGKKHSVQVIP